MPTFYAVVAVTADTVDDARDVLGERLDHDLLCYRSEHPHDSIDDYEITATSPFLTFDPWDTVTDIHRSMCVPALWSADTPDAVARDLGAAGFEISDPDTDDVGDDTDCSVWFGTAVAE